MFDRLHEKKQGHAQMGSECTYNYNLKNLLSPQKLYALLNVESISVSSSSNLISNSSNC